MKYNKNADTLLFLLLFATGQRENNVKNIICAWRRYKKVKSNGLWVHFTPISTES